MLAEEAVNAAGDLVIERVAETGSTNSDLLARVHAAAASRRDGVRALPARRRPADRRPRPARPALARRRRARRSPSRSPGRCARSDLSGLSLAVGVALAEALEPPKGRPARIGLKWPNDLWLVAADAASPPGRKLAGVLVETAPLGRGRVAVDRHRHQRRRAGRRRRGLGRRQPGRDRRRGDAGDDARARRAGRSSPRCASSTPPASRPSPIASRRATCCAAGASFGDGAADALEGVAVGVAADGALLLQTAAGVRAVTSGEWRLRRAEPAGSPC